MSEDYEHMKIQDIPLELIIIPEDNPRQNFDEESLRRLGESIKTHGQIEPIIVRRKGDYYELVVGERRVRACALVGLGGIEARVQWVDDVTAMELRLIENTQREDLSDAEKGDAVLSLWANYDKYETIKDVALAINTPQGTVYDWTKQSRKLSEKIKEAVSSRLLMNEHARQLMKYPHSVQNKLADVIIKRGISSHKEVLRRFTKLYDANPKAELNKLADKVLGIETVTIPKTELTSEQKQKLDEKKQLAKVKRIRKKRSKPLTKEQVKQKSKKKTDFKFEPVKIIHGSGKIKPPTPTIKPTILGTTKLPSEPDWTLCKCHTCPLFGKYCKGRQTQ